MAPLMLMGCKGSTPANEQADPPASPAGFSGELDCPAGEEVGDAFWDYSPNPRGQTTDAVAWVRRHADGLDGSLDLTFLPTAGDLEDVVVATGEDGTALAFVAFGKDEGGRYYPTEAKACPSSGIEDFT
jgi:hypothetical protein